MTLVAYVCVTMWNDIATGSVTTPEKRICIKNSICDFSTFKRQMVKSQQTWCHWVIHFWIRIHHNHANYVANSQISYYKEWRNQQSLKNWLWKMTLVAYVCVTMWNDVVTRSVTTPQKRICIKNSICDFSTFKRQMVKSQQTWCHWVIYFSIRIHNNHVNYVANSQISYYKECRTRSH